LHIASPPAVGDIVWIRQERWRIDRLRRAREVAILDVVSRGRASGARTFLTPFDRPLVERGDGRVRRVRWRQARARLAGLAARAHGFRTPVAAVDAAVDLLPFQLEPALAFADGARRVLLADDVGLGKTIQAGLVIAELRRRNPRAWVLVVVPASIRDQWAGELSQRFATDTLTADAESLSRLAEAIPRGSSVWCPGVWIASPDYLKQPHVFTAVPIRRWDLVVIDEAHDSAGDSERHAACHAIARRSRRVLLLTATPHNGDAAAFDRLCRIGELDERVGGDQLITLSRTRASVGWASTRRVRWHRVAPGAAGSEVLDALMTFERAVLRAAGAERRSAALLLLAVLRKRALSTNAALAVSLHRRSAWLDGIPMETQDWSQATFDFGDGADEFRDDEAAALSADIGLTRNHERAWIRRLTQLAERAGLGPQGPSSEDAKLARVAALIRRAREPVVVFTEFRHSLEAVCRVLTPVTSVTALHGGLGPRERRRALERFLGGDARVLVATDVAGQGLNLQTRARWVINLELPWNPARLEQRAGRVDRIGQSRPVHVTMLLSRHPAESAVLARMAARALRAREAIGASVAGLTWPSEAELWPMLIGGDAVPLEAPTTAAVTISRRWQRPAERLTRDLHRRRRWAAHWRGQFIPAAGPFVTRLPLPHLSAGATAIAIFSVPFVMATGEVVETHLSACGFGRHGDWRRELDAARQRMTTDSGRSATALRRRIRQRHVMAAAIDDAIARGLDRERRTRSAQPGLFDRTRDVQTDVPPTNDDEPFAIEVGHVGLVGIVETRR
jgi:superfamily II DNA or RNA helicase